MWTSLIGFMGSGKSTVARRLRSATSRPVVSLDEVIVQRTGQSIPDLFNRGGEPAFRQAELDALLSLDADRNLVLDTGGGIVQTPDAVSCIRSRGPVLWLDAPWSVTRSRLKEDGQPERPLIQRLGWAELERLFRQRRPLYAAAADFRLASGFRQIDDLARTAMIRSLLWERQKSGEDR